MHYVYLHGFTSGGDSTKGGYFKKRFSEKGLDLHTPDLNGDFSHMTLSSQLELVRELVARLDGEVTMMGSSLGGYLSALFAEEEERVVRMVLIAPAFKFYSRYIERLGEDGLAQWNKRDYIKVFHHIYQEERPLDVGIVDDAKTYDKIELRRDIATLVMHGLHDESVHYDLSVDYTRSHPASRLVLLNTDHGMIDVMEEMWGYVSTFCGL